MKSHYEAMPHGKPGFRIAVFSEKKYDAPLHHHDEYGIFYLAEGKMKFGIAGDDYEISAGDIIFVEPNTPYYAVYTDNHDRFHYYSIIFHAELLGGEDDPCRKFLEECRINRFLVLSDELLSNMPKMRQWELEKNFGNEILIKSALLDIFTHIIKTGQYIRISELFDVNKKNVPEAVNLVIKYIEEHYKDRISLENLLEQIPYSKSHLLRIFKIHTGMSIVDYINKFRIEKACLELIYSNKSATEIALNNGFNTTQYFTKIFRRYIGCTPVVYRKFSHAKTNIPRD